VGQGPRKKGAHAKLPSSAEEPAMLWRGKALAEDEWEPENCVGMKNASTPTGKSCRKGFVHSRGVDLGVQKLKPLVEGGEKSIKRRTANPLAMGCLKEGLHFAVEEVKKDLFMV